MLTAVGRYQIKNKIGEGGLGAVYLAVDPAIGRNLAVKVIQVAEGEDELAQRILREVRVLGQLSHPNIITLYDVGQAEEYVYIAMEYVEGSSLSGLLKSGGLKQQVVRQVLRSVAEALDYAHQRDIVHRDIKPSNIMVGSDGSIKVVDFGIARAVMAAKESAKESQIDIITDRFTVVGTPGFLSPEQIRGFGEKDISGASDQFSLAVVAYLLLTGSMPFHGNSPVSTFSDILNGTQVPAHTLNSTLNPAVDEVLNRALAKWPRERYESCRKFISELMAACDSWPRWNPGDQSQSDFASAETPTTKFAPERTQPGEFTRMFRGLAEAGSLAALENKGVPSIFPEAKTTFFKAQNDRFQKIEESIKFYRDNLTAEYAGLTKQANLTYRLWLACVGLGFAILASGITLMFVGDLRKGALTATSTVLVYFIQKVFQQREDYYRHSADSKSKHLQYGNQWLLVIQSVDAIEDPSERVKRQTTLVDVLTERLHTDTSLNSGDVKRPSRRSKNSTAER